MAMKTGEIEAMVAAGELERVGDPTADPRVYRETASGAYRIASDAHGLWSGRWPTEWQALAVAEFDAVTREIDGAAKDVGYASGDASAAALRAAQPLLAKAAAYLARAVEALEETPQTDGDGPNGGELILDLIDPERAEKEREAARAEEEAVPLETLKARTRAAIEEYEAAWGVKDWSERNEGKLQHSRDRRRDAGRVLADALIDLAERAREWGVRGAAALYRDKIYEPAGLDDDGVPQVSSTRLADVILLDDSKGDDAGGRTDGE